jgi:hypothetical protein
VTFRPGGAFTQHRRLALLRQYLADNAAPARARAAAVLLLLYAQPLSRIQRLTRGDLLDVDGQQQLRLGNPPSPVPAVVAKLLRQLVDDLDASTRAGRWLFPGRLPGQPAAYNTMHRWLRELGFPLIEPRVSALRQLVLQAPAAVIADALGFHQTTTKRQHAHAGGAWSRYPACGDQTRPPHPDAGIPSAIACEIGGLRRVTRCVDVAQGGGLRTGVEHAVS